MTARQIKSRREYGGLLEGVPAHAGPTLRGVEREAAMSRVISLLWALLEPRDVSWIGFYEKVVGADEMMLICREPKPACSPIGLFGMCGRGWVERRPIIIDDVRTLGQAYIACDPRDQSELVIPVMNDDGSCWGVLDVDSYSIGAFEASDLDGMRAVMERTGISAVPSAALREPLRL